MLQGGVATGHFSCTSGAGRWASKSLGDSCSPHHTAEWSDVLEGVKTATWTACDGKTKGRRLDRRRNFNERPVIHTYFLVLVVHMRDFKTWTLQSKDGKINTEMSRASRLTSPMIHLRTWGTAHRLPVENHFQSLWTKDCSTTSSDSCSLL